MALFAEISSSYVYGEMAHPAPINQTSFRSSGSTVPQEGRNDPVVVTFHQDLHASHGSMVAELAQALCRQPNRGDVGQADSDRPAEHMYERAVQVRREVDVLLCVLSGDKPDRQSRLFVLLYDKRSTLSVAVLTAIVGYGYLTGYGDQA
jgi:hypothetical protein